MEWCQKLSIRMFLKLWQYRIIWYLFTGFKIIILCSVHSLWFVRYVFSAKIWFVKTWTRIVKCESRVVKSNTVYIYLIFCMSIFLHFFLCKKKKKGSTYLNIFCTKLNPLSANPRKWSKTLKQFVDNLSTNCLSMFDHFLGLGLKEVNPCQKNIRQCNLIFYETNGSEEKETLAWNWLMNVGF